MEAGVGDEGDGRQGQQGVGDEGDGRQGQQGLGEEESALDDELELEIKEEEESSLTLG